MKPFRWNLNKREQLGRLIEGEGSPSYPGYEHELAECAVKVVARSSGRRIIFVGRSPENIFDYLSGVFNATSHESKIGMLNISNRFRDIESIKQELPTSYLALKDHFSALNISPKDIATDQEGVCFCDLVASGGTFEQIFSFIQAWVLEENKDLRAVEHKLSFVGITQRTKNSPNTWRWQQHANWVVEHNRLIVKNVSVPASLWDYLGNRQRKVSKTNVPEAWGDDELLLPPRDEGNIKALKQAYNIFTLGAAQRKDFAEKLAMVQEVKETWLRDLISELKRSKTSLDYI